MSIKKTAFVFLTIGALLFCSGCSPSYTPPETRLVVDVQYDNIEFYGADFFIVEQNGLYGAYCRDGEEYRLAIPVEYAKLEAFGSEKAELVMATASDGTIIALSPQGEQLTSETYQKYHFTNFPHSSGLEVSPDGTSWGFLSWSGEWILPPEYNWVDYREGGTFITYQGSERETVTDIMLDPNVRVDWLDHNGRSLLPDGYQIIQANEVASHGDYSYLSARFQNTEEQTWDSYGKNCLLRWDGTCLVQSQYDILIDQDETGNLFFFGQNFDGAQTYIDVYDEQGRLLLEHSSVSEAVGDRMFTNAQKEYVITADGEEVTFPQPYDHLFHNGKFVWVETDGEYRPYDWYGNLIADIRCTSYQPVDSQGNVFQYISNGKMGVISADGSIQIPAEYEITYLRYTPSIGLLRLQKGDRWGVLRKDGTELLPFEYEQISSFSEQGYYSAVKDGKMGILDNQGHIIEDFSYDAPPDSKELSFSGNYFVVWKENKCGLIAVQ